ncbi:uncharacterized protein LOC5564430 [Aedes aegypti]|uniref:CHK domain-containing protein n=1 Tax=Aedes aegypti TaxID=7159 RepID=A0A1S4G1W8_AEDAE|nr:uncharacterized protein LOC5564430 [Aedes aegypti]
MSTTSEIIISKEAVDGWRNLDFFRDVVSKDLSLPEDEFCLSNLVVTDATGKQSGFMSLLHRVKLDVELKGGNREQKSYIVKEKSNDVFGGDMVDKFNVFEKEIEAYQKLIPEFEKLFPHKVKFGPKFFKSVTFPFTVIVMEDLNASGYVMKNCSKRLDISQSKTVLSRMAKFHAASVVYFKQNGPYPKSFKTGMYDEDSAADCEAYIGNLYKSLVASLIERKCSNQFLELINQWGANPYVAGARLFRLNDNDFNVLNHGDLWMNNVMFSDNDLLMIDFQIAFYGSFTFDLLEFIFCTVEVDDIINQFDDLIEFYHHELRTAFQMLDNSNMLPSLETLQADIKRHGFLAALLMIEAIPMISYIKVGELSLELMSSSEPEGEEFRRKLYHNEKYIEVVDRLLPFLFERGYLKCSTDF